MDKIEQSISEMGLFRTKYTNDEISMYVNGVINERNELRKIISRIQDTIEDLRNDIKNDVNMYHSHTEKEIRDDKIYFAIEVLEDILNN